MNAWRAAVFGLIIFLAASMVVQADVPRGITISAPAFASGAAIPAKYSYKGGDVSPELRISGVPVNAKSLVLVVDDPDSPSGLWTHWLVWNISPKTTIIAEGKVPPGAVQGKNSFGHVRYDGPVPPSGTHHYFFRIYALNILLSLPSGASRREVYGTFGPVDLGQFEHAIGFGDTMGTYSASH